MSQKKIGITGHTSGIGLALAEFFSQNGDAVTGYSRTNGFEIETNFEKLIQAAQVQSVFINNAYAGFYNVELLYRLFELWRGEDKIIINISSDSADGNKNFIHRYAVEKAALDKACEQLQNVESRCRVINIRPGFVDTPRVKSIDALKLRTEDIVKTIDWCLNQPSHVYLRTITLKVRS